MIPLVILVGADKGGVGKTTVTRALADYLDAKGIASRIFDTEHPGGDLVRFRSSATVVDGLSVEDQMKVFDGVSAAEVTVVDIRAGLLSRVLKVLDDAHLLDEVRSGEINLALLHVLGPSVASLNEIRDAADLVGEGAHHFFVLNHINDTAFKLAGDPRYAQVLAAAADVTIDVPKLTEVACEEIQGKGVGFAAFADDRSNSRMLRGLVKTWLAAVSQEFERVGLGKLAGKR